MSFGLSETAINILKSIFKKHLKSGTVLVYGSRAKGTYTSRSDIDLVIKGSPILESSLLAEITEDIDDSDIPCLVDLQFYEQIHNPALLDHIDRVGKVLYQGK